MSGGHVADFKAEHVLFVVRQRPDALPLLRIVAEATTEGRVFGTDSERCLGWRRAAPLPEDTDLSVRAARDEVAVDDHHGVDGLRVLLREIALVQGRQFKAD